MLCYVMNTKCEAKNGTEISVPKLLKCHLDLKSVCNYGTDCQSGETSINPPIYVFTDFIFIVQRSLFAINYTFFDFLSDIMTFIITIVKYDIDCFRIFIRISYPDPISHRPTRIFAFFVNKVWDKYGCILISKA